MDVRTSETNTTVPHKEHPCNLSKDIPARPRVSILPTQFTRFLHRLSTGAGDLYRYSSNSVQTKKCKSEGG